MDSGAVEVCLLPAEHVGNDNLGIVHGGALSTFADMALGCAAGHHLRGGAPLDDPKTSHFVTVQLQVQFLAAAQVGAMIVCRPEVVRATSQLLFVRGILESNGRPVVSADGIFKTLDAAKVDKLRAG